MSGESRQEHLRQFLVAAQLQVLVIEPLALFIIELGTGFRHAIQREVLNQLIHGVHLFISASMPSEERKEVDHRLRQISALAVAGRNGAIFLIMELEREDGETETVTVTLGQFAVSVRLEQQGQVGKLGHRILPSECTVEEYVERGRR